MCQTLNVRERLGPEMSEPLSVHTNFGPDLSQLGAFPAALHVHRLSAKTLPFHNPL